MAGHIPGAVNLPSTGNHAADGRFLPPAIIADRYARLGSHSGAVLYCGSGVTAAQSLLALESAGLTAAIYPGSWSDWITDPDRPIATGRYRQAPIAILWVLGDPAEVAIGRLFDEDLSRSEPATGSHEKSPLVDFSGDQSWTLTQNRHWSTFR